MTSNTPEEMVPPTLNPTADIEFIIPTYLPTLEDKQRATAIYAELTKKLGYKDA